MASAEADATGAAEAVSVLDAVLLQAVTARAPTAKAAAAMTVLRTDRPERLRVLLVFMAFLSWA
jgi:hypothetical protein